MNMQRFNELRAEILLKLRQHKVDAAVCQQVLDCAVPSDQLPSDPIVRAARKRLQELQASVT